MQGTINWRIRRTPDGHEATITIPTEASPVSISAIGFDEKAALSTAASVANQLAKNPIFQAVAPPGTAAALKAINLLAKSKVASKVLSTFAGPGARRLASALGHRLHFW